MNNSLIKLDVRSPDTEVQNNDINIFDIIYGFHSNREEENYFKENKFEEWERNAIDIEFEFIQK